MRYQPLNEKKVVRNIKYLVEKRRYFRNSKLTSEQLADELGISRCSFSKAVNGIMGMTFSEYINNVRLENAVKILEDNKRNLTIEAIAIKSGYSTPSTFYRQYKRKYGKTPTSRKQGD